MAGLLRDPIAVLDTSVAIDLHRGDLIDAFSASSAIHGA